MISKNKITPLVPSPHIMFSLFYSLYQLLVNFLSFLLFLIQLFNELRKSLSNTSGMSSILLFFLITSFLFCDTGENWDSGSKLFLLFRLRTNWVKFFTELQLCCPVISSQAHWHFSHHMSLTMASFFPSNLP